MYPTAVQHERGPRKPKLHPGSLMHQGMSHHQQHVQPKESLKMSPAGHSKFQLQVSPTSMFTPLKPLSLGGSSAGSAPPASPLPGGPIEPPPPFFQPPPPPGLLHILMSAEKCQVREILFVSHIDMTCGLCL